MEIKAYYAKTPEQKSSVTRNKERIVREFREGLGIVWDQVKQGAGNSNTGNANARRILRVQFFIMAFFGIVMANGKVTFCFQ